MGSFDEEKFCELVGLYIQSKLEKILRNSNCGLALLRNLKGQQSDKFGNYHQSI